MLGGAPRGVRRLGEPGGTLDEAPGRGESAGWPAKRPFVFVQYCDGGRRDGADPAGMERRAARDRHDRTAGRIGAGRDAIVAALREISAV
ncbi:hypothetical protein [Burkholderia pseudomallei]|uniref:Uncharacterized protein n=1 Tax=Burkholderia pseudomallei (strain 1106a) TaxID=357348 RepID=A3P496_BURP0|nr:hypothetical protein [Burkholderia pseudomallei]ABN95673.1 hypothetical protein BURPS1106A_A1121 [Burkholderia pseudomallei 1106a]AFR19068.1 hypothetical protein BPC006_II1140 [Burkholderia pseudomallei BPC006]EES20851.1 hypothetical protein BURPS1106B_0868 [Burkholderia pseudomallei 1106b]MCV9979981.1 hypothetical protein [Burkholderia pseudomallei]MCW0054177.1 hypothetical protein [Burkholderia pseudomallei]